MHSREGPSGNVHHAIAAIALVVAAALLAGCTGREGPGATATPAPSARPTARATEVPAATVATTAAPTADASPAAVPTAAPASTPAPTAAATPTATPHPEKQMPILPDGERCESDADCASAHCGNGLCCAEGRRCCAHNAGCELSEVCDTDVCHCCTETAAHTEQTLTKVEVCEIEKDDVQYCYREVAVEDRDAELCDRIDDGSARDACVLEIAREQSAACPQYPIPRGLKGCLDEVAVDPNAILVCDAIEADDIRDRCYLLLFDVRRDAAICARLVGQVGRNGCFAQLAAAERDSSLCDRVEGEEYRDDCLSAVAEALGFSDPVLCGRMAGEPSRDACYGKVVNATAQKGDPSGCSSISIERYRELCLAQVAPIAKDKAVCDAIDSGEMRDRCISAVAPAVKEAALCETIASDEPPYLYRTTCITEVAHATRDGALCAGIADLDERAVCAAFAAGQPAPCDGATTTLKVDKCRWLVARRFNSTEVCNTILDNDYRYKCLRDVFWWGQT